MSHYKIFRNQLDIKQNVVEAKLLFDDYLHSLVLYDKMTAKRRSKTAIGQTCLDKTPRSIKRKIPKNDKEASALKKSSHLPLSYLGAESILTSKDVSKEKSPVMISKSFDRKDFNKKYSLKNVQSGCSKSILKSNPSSEASRPAKLRKTVPKDDPELPEKEVKVLNYQDTIEEDDLHLERRPIEYLIDEQYDDLTGFYRIEDFDNWDCDYDDDSATD